MAHTVLNILDLSATFATGIKNAGIHRRIRIDIRRTSAHDTQKKNHHEKRHRLYETEDDDVVTKAFSRFRQSITRYRSRFTLKPGGETHGDSAEYAGPKEEPRIGTGRGGSSQSVHENEPVDSLRKWSPDKSDQKEGSRFVLDETLLPCSNRRHSRSTGTEGRTDRRKRQC